MTDRSLCGIIGEDGSDCSRPVEPGTPLNLCRHHLAAAYFWVSDAIAVSGGASTILTDCPSCERRARRRTSRVPGEPSAPWVYYVSFDNRIKIGTTKDLPMRLANIPYDDLLAVEPGSVEVEQLRHLEFEEARVIGEWFVRSPELMEHIAELRSLHPLPAAARGHG